MEEQKLNILFVTGATHLSYMKNMNHFQRVYFLSRKCHLSILAKKNSRFDRSASPNTTILKAPLRGKIGYVLFGLYWAAFKSKRRQFDIILSEPSVMGLLGAFVKFRTKAKWVVDIWDIPIRNQTGGSFQNYRTLALRKLASNFYRYADFFILSILPNFELTKFGIPDEKMHLEKNAIFPIKERFTTPDPVEKNFSILCMKSKFSSFSGLDTLSQAFLKLVRIHTDITLYIVGHIPSAISHHILALQNRPDVILIDFEEHSQLLERISTADLCVVPYRSTPDLNQIYPIKVIEYLSLGIPVVSSNLAGIRGLIKDGKTGLFFEAGDAVELAEKMELLIRDRSLRQTMSENAKKEAEGFGCEEKNDRIFHVLQWLVKEEQ